MDIQYLERVFPKIWCRETSAYPDRWTPENPAYGQCLSTARIAERCLGGEIILVFLLPEVPHFYNVLPGGRTHDFTRSQFLFEFALPEGRPMQIREIDGLGHWFPEVNRRYHRLANKFMDIAGVNLV